MQFKVNSNNDYAKWTKWIWNQRYNSTFSNKDYGLTLKMKKKITFHSNLHVKKIKYLREIPKIVCNHSRNGTFSDTEWRQIENETIYNTFKSVSGRASEKESNI